MAVEFKDRLLSQAEEDQLLELISKTAGIDVVCIIDRNQTKEMAYKSVIEHTMTNVRQKDGQFYRGNSQKKGRFWNQIPVFLYSEMWSMGQK